MLLFQLRERTHSLQPSQEHQNTAVAWSLNGAGCSVASCGTLATSSLAAVYAAPLVAPSPPTVNVVATSMADPSKTASASVSIMSVVAVTVTPNSTSVGTGATQQLNASVVGDLEYRCDMELAGSRM